MTASRVVVCLCHVYLSGDFHFVTLLFLPRRDSVQEVPGTRQEADAAQVVVLCHRQGRPDLRAGTRGCDHRQSIINRSINHVHLILTQLLLSICTAFNMICFSLSGSFKIDCATCPTTSPSSSSHALTRPRARWRASSPLCLVNCGAGSSSARCCSSARATRSLLHSVVYCRFVTKSQNIVPRHRRRAEQE